MPALPIGIKVQPPRLSESQALAQQLFDAVSGLSSPLDRALKAGVQEALAASQAMTRVGVSHTFHLFEQRLTSVISSRLAAVEVDGIYFSVKTTGSLEDLFHRDGGPAPRGGFSSKIVEIVGEPLEPTMPVFVKRRQAAAEIMNPLAIQWALERRLAAAKSPRIAPRM